MAALEEIPNLELVLRDFICPSCKMAGRRLMKDGEQIYLQCPECGWRWSYIRTPAHLVVESHLIYGF